MGMHFKLGVYEQQSAGAVDGLIKVISENFTEILQDGNSDNIKCIKITTY